MKISVPLVLVIALAGCGKPGAHLGSDAALSTAGASPSAPPGPPPAPKTPRELFDAYQETLTAAAAEGQYMDVCKGSPWFPAPICQWVALRAQGKGVDRPDSDLYRNFFGREHWAHAWGTIVAEAGDNGDYEATAGGYHNHVILDTVDTKYETKGSFNLWVQEQPETREVTLNSGATGNWVVLTEMPLAKALMGLAHSGASVESTGIAKDAMKYIASYVPYSVLKGTVPPVPGASAPTVGASTAAAPGTAAPAAGAATAVAVGPSGMPVPTPEMAPCCAALEEAMRNADPAHPYPQVLIMDCTMNSPVPAAGRKQQMRDIAAQMKLPPLPAACQ